MRGRTWRLPDTGEYRRLFHAPALIAHPGRLYEERACDGEAMKTVGERAALHQGLSHPHLLAIIYLIDPTMPDASRKGAKAQRRCLYLRLRAFAWDSSGIAHSGSLKYYSCPSFFSDYPAQTFEGSNRRKTIVALCPPKPNPLFRAYSRGRSCGTFAVTFRSTWGSWLKTLIVGGTI